jgi:hypothetical protein
MRTIVCAFAVLATFAGCDVVEPTEEGEDGWMMIELENDDNVEGVSSLIENPWCTADAKGFIVNYSQMRFAGLANAGCGPGRSMSMTVRIQTRRNISKCTFIDGTGNTWSPITDYRDYASPAQTLRAGFCYRVKASAFGLNDYTTQWCYGAAPPSTGDC